MLVEAPRSTGEGRPMLSIIVVFHQMRREAPRTLLSLSRAYQRGVEAIDYEVIAVDSRSSAPLDPAEVEAFGPEFRYLRHETESVSPAEAVNRAAAMARGDYITVCVDGARILSPGIVRYTALGCRLSPRPVVAALGYHLGPMSQRDSTLAGYDQAVEDALLAGSGWERDGYRLFNISCFANASAGGWFTPPSESNCITVTRAMFDELGGFDTAFRSRGGGLVNPDFFRRACDAPGTQLVMLVSEGCFHQVHGGVSTNPPAGQRPDREFHAEYRRLRGDSYRRPTARPIYLGEVQDAAIPFLKASADHVAS